MQQCLKQFNCLQTNDLYKIELFVFDSNTWNNLTAYKQMIYTRKNYLC